MIPADQSAASPRRETPYTMVTEWAAEMPIATLTRILLGSLAAAGLVLGIARDLWPVAALAGTSASVALWGLLAHRRTPRFRIAVTLGQWILVVAGTLLAAAAGVVIISWILGPRWIL